MHKDQWIEEETKADPKSQKKARYLKYLDKLVSLGSNERMKEFTTGIKYVLEIYFPLG